ncbi:MAG: D-alanyl-D-alanine carboxypeptidase family protein [Hyphomicrobiales bacterium]
MTAGSTVKTIFRILLVLCFASQMALAQQADPDADPPAQNQAQKQTAQGKKGKPATPAKPVLPQGPFILVDSRSGEVLGEDRAGEPWYPASLTKLMTGYVVFKKLRAGVLKLDQPITVSVLANSQEPSKIGVPPGKTVTVDFALQALLVYSANDMAYVLAEGASGSVPAFVAEMNAEARRLGMTATHYANPNGLFDARHVSSARDLAVLAGVIINEFPEYQKYFEQEYVVVGKKRLGNHNSLVRSMPDADGMKTGFVCASGYNLVATATRDGRRLIAVVLGMRGGYARAEAAKGLLVNGFSMPANPAHGLVANVVNLPQGALVPVDMTPLVCKNKPVAVVDEDADLTGWAVSFGTYDTPQKADLALRGRVLSPLALDATGRPAIIRLPEKAGFAPVIFGLSQPESLTICNGMKIDGAYCEVLPDTLIASIADTARQQQAQAAAAAAAPAEGSDDDAGAAMKPRGPRMGH